MHECPDLYACKEGPHTSQSRWQWTTLRAASTIDSMLDLLLKKGASYPRFLNKPPAISRTRAAPVSGSLYVSVRRRFYMVDPSIVLELVALSMELLQVSTSSRTSARRLRGSGGRARAVSRNGQGRWARLCACGCAHQSGMLLRAACEIRSAPGTMCMSAGRANSGQFGPKGTVRGYGMLRAQNAKSVLVHHFLYIIVVRSRSQTPNFT